MDRKIQIGTYISILIILICMFIGIGIVRGQSVSDVSSFKMSSSTSSSVSLKWSKIKKSSGYYIYKYNDKTKKYDNYKKINDSSSNTIEIKNLDGGVKTKLAIKAFKIFAGKEYISKSATKLLAYTLPSKPSISAFSGGKGVLSVEWNEANDSNGFEIQYSLNENFDNAYTKVEKSSNARNFSVKNLKAGDIYYVRVRAFLTIDNQNIYGDWSDSKTAKINNKDLIIDYLNPDKPMVALSFDDGPAYTYDGENSTSRILDTLEKYGAHATFFMVGERVNSETQDLLKRELLLGCELGNHTYDHSHYGADVTVKDVSKCSEQIKKYAGQYPTFFRCPGGSVTKKIRNECKNENMALAYWSVDTLDWKSKDADKIYNRALSGVYDGSIILMHDIYSTTADAVEKIVPELVKRGYQVVTVSELIKAKTQAEPKAGQQYVDYKTINNKTK